MEITIENVEFTAHAEMDVWVHQPYPDATGWNYIFDTRDLVVTWE